MTQRDSYIRLLLYATLVMTFVLAVLPDSEGLPEVARISDKANHIAAFFVLALLMDHSFPQKSLLWKSLWLIAYGALIEAVQSLLPHRECSLADMAADTGGIITYILSKSVLLRVWGRLRGSN